MPDRRLPSCIRVARDVRRPQYPKRLRETPSLRPPGGGKHRVFYEHRIVGQALGVAGDIDIASFPPTLEQVQNFSQEAGEMEREKTQRERRVFRFR